MRIGYLGGSFDPPHRAHLRVAELARTHFGLDRILLAPTGRQPLKSTGAQAPFADRLRMVELLCEGQPGLEASAIDGPRPDGEPNYTVDTLRRLRAALAIVAPTGTALEDSAHPSHPAPTAAADSELFAIVGADAFLGMGQWRDPAELFRLAQWIVISRPGFPVNSPAESEALRLTPAQRAAVHLLPGLHERLSATDLRRRLRAGEDCGTSIPPAVLQYMEDRHLYRG